MTKWTFLFCVLTLLADVPAAAQKSLNLADTLELPFGLIGRQAGDTSYLYMDSPTVTRPVMESFARYFNKNLGGAYHGDTMVSGLAIIWFVIDKQGICTRSYCDTAVSEPEIAQEVLWVTNKMNSMHTVTPSMIGGTPVISRVKMRVVYQFAVNYVDPPPPPGPKPDILVVGYPPQR